MQEEKEILVFSLSLLFILLLIAAVVTIVATGPTATRAQQSTAVIFRLDDVQDNFANQGTKAVMDLFIQKKVPLTTAIIASAIGKDPIITQATSEGIKNGVFEAALHGFKHLDYSTLNANNQSVSMTQGNNAIKQLFGVHPFVFVPPFNTFNNNTLSAMRQHDMNILSSTLGSESLEHTKGQIYNVTDMHSCGTSEAGIVCPTTNPIHLSAGNDFRIITDSNITQQSNAQILKEIQDNGNNYGYSILVLHPQDFVITDPKTGKVVHNAINQKQIQQLSTLIDQVKKNYTVSSMKDLVQSTNPVKTTSAVPTTPTTTTKKFAVQDVSSKSSNNNNNNNPTKQVILTLDDDWKGQLTNGVPILKKYGFNATFFLTCKGPIAQDPTFTRIDYVNDKQKQSNDITTWNEVKLIRSMGYDYENHGMTHHSLVNQPSSILQREILDSKTCFEQHLGYSPIVYAPAYAAPENNVTVNNYISKGKYEFARNGYGPGHYDDHRFDLPTMSMNQWDKQFNHNVAQILPAFADDMKKAELPVLVYHNINNLKNTESNWYNSTTTPQTFDAEMKWLKDNGYQVHAIADLKWDSQKGEFYFP